MFGNGTDLSTYGIRGNQDDGTFANGFDALRALCEHFELVRGWLLVVPWLAAFGEPPSEQLARAAHDDEALLCYKAATHLEATLRHPDVTLPGHLSPKISQFFDWVKADLGASVMALVLGSRPPEDTLGKAVLPEGPRTC